VPVADPETDAHSLSFSDSNAATLEAGQADLKVDCYIFRLLHFRVEIWCVRLLRSELSALPVATERA
jgi:hypothetical protein